MVGLSSVIKAKTPDFCGMSGMGRDAVLKMIRTGELKTVRNGRWQLIVIDSYRRWVERQLEKGVAECNPVPAKAHAARMAKVAERQRLAEEAKRREGQEMLRSMGLL